MRENVKTIISLLCKEFFLKRLTSAIDEEFVVKHRDQENCTAHVIGWYPRNLVIATVNDAIHDYDVTAIKYRWFMTDIELSVRKD